VKLWREAISLLGGILGISPREYIYTANEIPPSQMIEGYDAAWDFMEGVQIRDS